MTAEEIINILYSTSKEDWIESPDTDSYTYRADVLLRIQKYPVDYSITFEGEDWAVNHNDPHAFKVFYDVYYGNSLIMEKTLVLVDGCRAILPMPRKGTTEISLEDYKFAKIVAPNSLDEYIARSGLNVAEAN